MNKVGTTEVETDECVDVPHKVHPVIGKQVKRKYFIYSKNFDLNLKMSTFFSNWKHKKKNLNFFLFSWPLILFPGN